MVIGASRSVEPLSKMWLRIAVLAHGGLISKKSRMVLNGGNVHRRFIPPEYFSTRRLAVCQPPPPATSSTRSFHFLRAT
jgi:hypothetical protein